MSLTVGSLFAGIGGMDLGLERAGMTVKWQVEIDPFCRKVLAKHWPNVTRYEDVRDVGAHNLQPVDLICGGFPCQPVSVAGKQLAQDDPRWLWPEFARIIRELRPSYALMENVPGLLVRGFSETWPPSGTMRSGRACRRRPLVPRTSDFASSYLPTPTASEGGYQRSYGPNAKIRPSLGMMARRGLWGTPTASCWKGSGPVGSRSWHHDMSNGNLKAQVMEKGASGQLNPTWVEWLMGFPPNWTEV